MGRDIEAILRLNTAPFEGSLETTRKAVNTFKNSMLKMGQESKTVEAGIYNIQKALSILIPYLNRFINLTQQTKTFNSFANGLKHMSEAVMNLSNVTKSSQVGMIRIKEIINAWSNAAKGLTVNIRGNVSAEQQETSTLSQLKNSYESAYASHVKLSRAVQQYSSAIGPVQATQRQMITLGMGVRTATMEEASAHNQNTSAVERETNAKNRNVSATQKQSYANKMLGSSLGMLRNGLTMVGSMIAYNFIHKLGQATTETINAKSEMNGYFQMLGFTKRQVADFNSELDKTIEKFPRLNKYALGETISSIGVEFELTTAEMKKAMPVVSMITSEYLRAGRNVNEASLAVKDILQGEFQRLSRETGVKGDQLREAGWSGDKNDVMGLLEALDKVGKSRNWDTFVQKANSLNDAVLIMQNRFGEWSADMVERVQPTIVGVFNMIMETAQKLASVLDGVLDWLGGDGIESQVTKWALLGTTILGVVGAFIRYRTGAGLIQIAQMGLSGTITSTVLGLNAETVATYGSLTAIKSKILGLEAEKVATLSTKDAILSKILGLDAELVAQTSLKQGILNNAFAQELQTLKLKGATKEELLNTLALYENQLAQKSTIGLLSAQVMGLDMTTYATHGFTVALLEAKTGMKASQIASMNLAQKIVLLGTSFIIPTAIVGAFTVALGILALKMNDSAKEMEKFNNLVKNGASIIKENKEIVEEYTTRQEALKKQLDETTEGTVEYHKIQERLLATNKDLETANYNLQNSIKAVELANSSQKHYEEALTDMAIDHQNKLAESYMNAGYSAQESYEMANSSLIDAQKGAEQLRITLQKIAQLQGKGEQNINYLLGVYQSSGTDLNDPETKEHLKTAESLNEKMQKAMEKGLTDESFMGRIDGWLSYYQYQLESWINNIGATVQSGDWGAVFDNIWKGIAHGFADLPFIKDFWGWVYDQIGVDNYAGQGWDAFGNMGRDLINHIFNPKNWMGSTENDPLKALVQWIAQGGANIDLSFIDKWIQDIINYFTKGLKNPSASKTVNVGDIVRGIIDWGSDALGKLAQDIVNLFRDALVNGIKNIPIVGSITDLLGLGDDAESSAQSKGESVGSSFSGGVQTGITGLDDVINTALSGLNLDDVTAQFMNNSTNITTTATSTASNVSSSFNTMRNNQKNALDSMVSKNTTAFNDMKNKSNNSMIQMRDSTSNVTHQMTNAWRVMKDNIIASAEKIRTDSTARFNDLSGTIGRFYRNIQNPSSWGGGNQDRRSAGSSSLRSHSPTPTSRRVGRSVFGGFGGGYTGKDTMSISSLKRLICPNGDCGSLFDGYNNSDIVDVRSFLSLVGGEHGFGGWNFASNHNAFIKKKSDAWDTAPPIINLKGGIGTSTKFKVGEFNNGSPKISFGEFQSMAQAIFSAIPYRFYYDSSWKGSWLGALQAGACNCWDGAHALIAFANTCGFGGSIVHGTWTDPDGTQYPHVWATINGKKMDTTAWQQRGSWSAGGQSSRGSPTPQTQTPINITVNVENAYGIDDLNSQIEEGIDKGLQKHFNNSYAIGV